MIDDGLPGDSTWKMADCILLLSEMKIILLSSENDKPEVGTTADQCRHAISYLKYYMKHLMEVQYEQDLQFPAIGKTRRKAK